MVKEPIWPSETVSSVAQPTNAAISSLVSVPPSRFLRMISWGNSMRRQTVFVRRWKLFGRVKCS
jgi:hypothetical protein